VFRGLALAGEEVEQLADGGLLAGRPGQQEAALDLVAAHPDQRHPHRLDRRGALALIVLVIFIAQNAQAVKLSFLGAQMRLSAGVVLLLAATAGALLMAAAGTARITQLRRAIYRTRRSQPPAPATPCKKEQRPC
jgi:lipopolysaccharide assembly protein A